MIGALVGISGASGSLAWSLAAFSGLLGAGFGLVNTPLVATISRLVSGEMLATALSVDSMLFFLGGSVGTAVLFAFSTTGGLADGSLNPLHSGSAAGFSDGFMLLILPVLAALALSAILPKVSRPDADETASAPEPQIEKNWVPNCSIPWHPDCVEMAPVLGD